MAPRNAPLALSDWVCAGATALAFVLAFPSPLGEGIWLLAWGAWIPLLFRLATRGSLSLREVALLGSGVALVVFYGSFSWLTFPIVHYGGVPTPIAYALLLIPAFVLSIFFSAFLWLARWGIVRWGRTGVFMAPFFWVALEWARVRLTRHGWNLFGYSQASVPELIQIARGTGVLGVSFLLLLANALGLFFILRETKLWRRLLLGIGAPLALVSLVFLVGRTARPEIQPGTSLVHVFAVQPVIPVIGRGAGLRAPDVVESLNRHLRLSEEVLAEGKGDDAHPRLLVWPESPMNLSLDEDEAIAAYLADFARRHGVYLLLNHLGKSGRGWHNSAAMLSPQGARIADYHKIRLLEFGEYVPGRELLPFLKKIPALAGDFVPGREYAVADVGRARIGTFICFESAFPEIPRALVRRGATLLVNISNDGWFGTTAGARQHLYHAVLRAVEMGRPLVRVTNSGITALITPYGEVRDATPLFQMATRHWLVRAPSSSSPLTWYARHGEFFAWFCAAASGGLLILGMYRKPRA
ncbi:MAG: apolipoprotein N-acyltransferase [Blastocatellia bacterium]|nr:apolipoprotein N-acyltransferase [Blastocatellia bacterium]MCS7157848.1 apolipoprotein N-acyltransferase [Blastocatellia bacterium]MCX7753415.1 apolipoprotein N-acyltransferase [Blastocatellia bacterium]MDW8168074.1 apolipoprotein N-acyltransferase [Acidobacteriota bacterium]MDW8257677.1 apolipoprotein N-acyltransferase [Acidobacteriota bacterium]